LVSRNKILSLLGAPQKTGGSNRNLLLGFINFWDKYYFPSFSIRFEYSNDDTNSNVRYIILRSGKKLYNRVTIGIIDVQFILK
jgi:hypothetical protein